MGTTKEKRIQQAWCSVMLCSVVPCNFYDICMYTMTMNMTFFQPCPPFPLNDLLHL